MAVSKQFGGVTLILFSTMVLINIRDFHFFSTSYLSRTSFIINNSSNKTVAQSSNDVSLLYKLASETTSIAETQYFAQREFELKNPTNDIFRSYAANYPCFWGVSYAWNNESIPHFNNRLPMDGGKWLCGIQFIQKPCIVYSFGSNHNYLFEYAYGLADKCQIYVFDPFNPPTKNESEKLKSFPNFHFYPWGVSDVNDYEHNRYRLSAIMSLLNHTHIDILKMDVEGWEYSAFHSLDKLNEWPSIGQIQIEIHARRAYDFQKAFGNYNISIQTGADENKQRLGVLIELLEAHNFRIFHIEPNVLYQDVCAEYALIQKDWRPHIKNYTL